MKNTIIKSFTSKSGRKIDLRYPTEQDLEGLLSFINELSLEDTYIRYSGVIVTREEEQQFLTDTLRKIKNDTSVMLLACEEDKIIGNSGISRDSAKGSRLHHVGTFGISLRKQFRGDGIGRILMETVLSEAKQKLNLKIAILTVFANNPTAPKLYESLGFKKYGILPQGILYKGEYIDLVYMYKKI